MIVLENRRRQKPSQKTDKNNWQHDAGAMMLLSWFIFYDIADWRLMCVFSHIQSQNSSMKVLDDTIALYIIFKTWHLCTSINCAWYFDLTHLNSSVFGKSIQNWLLCKITEMCLCKKFVSYKHLYSKLTNLFKTHLFSFGIVSFITFSISRWLVRDSAFSFKID